MSQANVRVCEHVDRVRGQLGRVLWWGGGRPGGRGSQKWGGGSRAASRGVAGIRQGGMCPKEGSSGTSCWAEFEKDGRVSESSKV